MCVYEFVIVKFYNKSVILSVFGTKKAMQTIFIVLTHYTMSRKFSQ